MVPAMTQRGTPPFRLLAGGACALALLLAACGGGDEAPQSERGATRLTVQETAGVPSAFVAFGIEKGFFAERGLDVALQTTQGGAATIPALVSGEIDVGGSNVATLLLGSSKGLPIRAIAGGTAARAAGEKDFAALLAAKGKGIDSPEELEGRTIAVNTLNNIAEVAVKASLEEHGVPPGSIRLSEVPFPEMDAALAGGTVDAALSIEPFATESAQKGRAVLGYAYNETEPGLQVGAYAVTEQFAESFPDAVKAFQAAIGETAEYIAAHEDEFRASLSKSARIPRELADAIVLPSWTGRVDAGSVAETAALMRRYGLVDRAIDTRPLLEGA
jgi:NitT/TauT family transport system substrate-binding protein